MAYSGNAHVPVVVAGVVAQAMSLTGVAKQTNGNKSNYHNLLTNRDLPDQHPIEAITGLQAILNTKFDDVEIVDGYMYLLCNGERVSGPHGPFAGGGGGGGTQNNAELKLSNESGWLYKSVAQNTPCYLKGTWSSVEDGISTGMGILTVSVGSVVRYSASVEQGPFSIDAAPYLASGSNTVRVKITDVYNNSRTLTYTINVVALYLESTFDGTTQYSGDITFYYTPTGAVDKTMHFELDGKEIGTEVVSVTGQQQEFIIPAQKHGSHTFRVYFTAEIGSDTVPSNDLFYDLMCKEDGNMTPIISSPFRPVPTEQFVTFTIPHIVYDPANLTASVEYKASGKSVNSLTVDRTEQKWSHRGDEVGDLELQIICGDTVKTFVVPITESSIDVSAVTNNLALHLTAYGRSNHEAEPQVWEYGDYAASLSNFNFTSDGWQLDEDGNTVLRVSGAARVYIPMQIFAEDFRTTGKTIELEFATRDVVNYDTVLLTCWSGGRGLEITAQRAMLKSEQSEIGTPYKEEEHIRLTFVIEKRANNRLVLAYINGIMSGAVQYPENDDFSQAEPVGISIGSSECTTDLYCIRVYDNDLTRYQVLNNWIADTQVGTLKKERYERNNIYDDYGRITIETLKKDLPYLVLKAPVLPQYKGDKRDVDDNFADPVNPQRGYTSEGSQIDVQGTSSQYYWRKNYKIKYKNGFILYDGTTVTVYAMNENAVPVAIFTMKADVASSEGYYNVETAKLFNKYHPFKMPAQVADPRVRYSIDGFPIVIFWDNGTETVFLGKYNFNNDKGTPEPFGLSTGDERWEVLQNGTARVGFHSADFSDASWKEDFEGNYPDGNTDVTNLEPMCAWVTSTDTDQATGEAIEPVTYDGVEYTADTAEYRLAKFKAELPEHFVEEAVIYYMVFTEAFLCMDQREKNVLWRYIKALQLWLADYYDADSIIGHNNQAQPVFDYWMEDIDYTASGDPVFNGQNSTFWKNIRATKSDKLKEEWHRLRKAGFSYESVMADFAEHKGKWCEAIYNEDMQAKCLDALIENGDGTYLPFLRGDKWAWTQWWMYNRFRYLDSKYEYGTSLENRATIRTNVMQNITATYYMKLYGHCYYNAEHIAERVEKDVPCEFVSHATGAEDRVIGLNDSDMITDLGDLSGHQVELIDLSKMVRLKSLKLGDGAADYVNNALNSVTFGNNILLRYVNIQNCTALTQAPDMSGCANIEEIRADGSSIAGLTLPNGGVLRVLHIPATITNISILNQTYLTDFSCPSFAQVTSLRIENCNAAVDTAAIVEQMQSTGRVRLIGMDWTLNSTALMDKLLGMRGLTETDGNADKPVLSGKVHFAAPLLVSKLVAYQDTFPYLSITADSYVNDVLMVTPEAVLLDSEGDLLTMHDGGHHTEYSAEQIDNFTTAVLEALASLESTTET